MSGKEILLVGAFHEMVELCELCNVKIAGIFDRELTGSFMGYEILGTDEFAVTRADQFRRVPVVISPDLPKIRYKLAEMYRAAGYIFTGLVSPTAMVSRTARVAVTAVVQHGVNISAGAVIGEFVKLNSLCNVMHDVSVGNYTTVAPNAVLLGYVSVGEHCYIGANSTILSNRKTGNSVTVGAGAIVTKDFGDSLTLVGNPARIHVPGEKR